MKTTRGTQFRVGLFVLIALLIGGGMAFLIGTQENLFASKTTYFTMFDNVSGLQVGAAVRLDGVGVGEVTEVEFAENGIIVKFRVVDEATNRLRGDPNLQDPFRAEPKVSLAAIGGKGLLGDKLLELTKGDDAYPAWDKKLPLPTKPPRGLVQQAEDFLVEAQGTATNLRLATDPFADQAFSNDLKHTARNLAKVTGMLADQDGTIQRLMNDRVLAQDVAGAVRNLRVAANEVGELANGLRAITDEIQRGDGTAHALIYGTAGAQAIVNIRDASGHLAALLEEIREGDGTAHKLVYDDVGDGVFKNLEKASADIAHMTDEMRQGKGTLGALLTDPSVYEDIKRLIGDLERNDILRALVRYSIRRDASRERVDVTPVPPDLEE